MNIHEAIEIIEDFKAMDDWTIVHCPPMHEALDVVVNEALRKPKLTWIPCSERLPEANGRYFVTRGLNACGSLWNRTYIANYSDLMGLKSERIWWNGNVGKSDFERIDDVIAWMPLPPSYRGDDK